MPAPVLLIFPFSSLARLSQPTRPPLPCMSLSSPLALRNPPALAQSPSNTTLSIWCLGKHSWKIVLRCYVAVLFIRPTFQIKRFILYRRGIFWLQTFEGGFNLIIFLYNFTIYFILLFTCISNDKTHSSLGFGRHCLFTCCSLHQKCGWSRFQRAKPLYVPSHNSKRNIRCCQEGLLRTCWRNRRNNVFAFRLIRRELVLQKVSRNPWS